MNIPLNLFVSGLFAYGLSSAIHGGPLSGYMIFASKEIGLTVTVVFLVSLILIVTLEQFYAKRKLVKAVLSQRKHKALSQHIKNGICGGSFAYLAAEQQYGTEHKLPPMSVVYVIDVDDMTGVATVVPKFQLERHHPLDIPRTSKDGDTTQFEWGHPLLTIEVHLGSLYKHVPRHMIPEII